MANRTEELIKKTFQVYRDAKVAHLFFMWPPMRPVGLMGSGRRKVPCFVQAGKAPFDVGGVYYDTQGTFIGAEIKETRDRDNRIPIVGPGKKGNGLQYHQLEALVQVHEAGGVALLVWNNAGEIGVLGGQDLAVAKVRYDASLKAEELKKSVAPGTRSILWGLFKPVKLGHDGLPLWLPPTPVAKKNASRKRKVS